MSTLGAVASLAVPGAAGAKKIYQGAKAIQKANGGGFGDAAKQFITNEKIAYQNAKGVSGISDARFLTLEYFSAYRENHVAEIIKNPLVKAPTNFVQKVYPDSNVAKIIDDVETNPIELVFNNFSKHTGKSYSGLASAVEDSLDVEHINKLKNTVANKYDNVKTLHDIKSDVQTLEGNDK